MSDPFRTEGSRAFTVAPEPDRDAKIEHLLLAGLDHYFAAQYEHAISVWSRVLFLDRSHARARAYIERARGALAERQRESEELLQNGMAAFQRGDGGEARRLLRAAIDGGAPTDEALAMLDRLDRLDPSAAAEPLARTRPARREVAPRAPKAPFAWSILTLVLMFVLALAATLLYSAMVWGPLDWAALSPLQGPPAQAIGRPASRAPSLPVPGRGELALARARALAADGHLRDALSTLDSIRPTDPQRADADRLRGEIQLQLIALTPVPSPSPPAPGAQPVR
jgi:hypothetical protein